jgi:DNA repair exonuclease SbcCD nuclease subunit
MYNIISCADLHIRSSAPIHRKDNYFDTVCFKFNQIIDLCNEHNAHLIIAGDLIDHVTVGHKVVNAILKILNRLNGKRVFVITGQHDLNYHTYDLSQSPIQTLIHANKIELLNNSHPIKIYNHWLYGCSFGKKVKVPKHKNSILVIHKTITENTPPKFLPEAVSAKSFLKKYSKKYRLIISGDFHYPFMVKRYGSTLINCGPMMRQSIDQRKLWPRVWLTNLKNYETSQLFLEIQPYKKVFSFENIKNDENSKFSEDFEELVGVLKNEAQKPDYVSVINLILNKSKVKKSVKDKIDYILNEVTNGGT